jgi:hypothetical protein
MRSSRAPTHTPDQDRGLTCVATRRGARLLHAGHVVSEILSAAGPTHSLFDVMAACVAVLADGPRLALLGFGGGSIVAPLRALGWRGRIQAVDLSLGAVLAYARVGGPDLGPVRVTIADVVRWLRAQRRPWDAIVEDLSVPHGDDLIMPEACFDPLPALVAARLARRGLAVVNVFSPGGPAWSATLKRLVPRGLEARVVHTHEFDHRLLILGRSLPDATHITRSVRAALTSIRSRQRDRFSVRGLA